jgi:threonine/homoserine/homoserine lactone efflux protein
LPIDSGVLVIFVPVVIILVTTPGPNTLYLVATGLSHGTHAAACAALGISLATSCHIVLTAIGVSSLVAASTFAFDAIRYAGFAYLLWLAYANLRIKGIDHGEVQPDYIARHQFRNGFFTNLLNPKSIVFCVFFLPQFVSVEHGFLFVQILTLGMILIAVGLFSDMMFAIGSGKIARYLRGKSGFLVVQKWLLSAVFVALAIRLMTLQPAR